MKWMSRSFGPGLLVVLCLACLSPAQTPASLRRNIENAIHDHRSLVIVLCAKQSSEDDEAYGDWSDNLNSFAAETAKSVSIVKTSSRTYSEVVEQPAIKDKFATLFVRDGREALLYGGMILEPQIYKLGWAFCRGQTNEKSITEYGLKQTSFQLRPAAPPKVERR